MAPKKGFKYRLKSAARFPVVRVAAGRGSGRNAANPVPGENPLVFLRVQVVACANLLSKDRNGLSDPFVVTSLLNIRHQTPVAKKTINPTYGAKDATFDFPIYVSTADRLGALELVVWDKDIMSKDYLGEAALPLDDWFEDLGGAARPWTFEESKPFSLNLESTRANTHATGSVQIQIGFYHPQPPDDVAYDAIYSELLRRSRPSVVSAPPTEGYGTIRSSLRDPAFEDDGLPSDEESDEDDYVDASEGPSTPLSELYTPPTTTTATDQSELQRQQAKALPQLNILPSSPNPQMSPDSTQTPTAKTPLSALIPTSAAPPKSPKTPSSPGFKKFGIPLPRRISGLSHTSSSSNLNTPPSTVPSPAPAQDPVTGALIPGTPASAPETESEGSEKDKKKRFSKSFIGGNLSDSAAEPGGRRRRKSREGYKLAMDAADDIVGIVMLEIQSADDLPKFKNMTRTGWDMDPFVVVSFSKKVFRTRVVRHSLNPVWDEKLLFHVRRYETSFQVQLSILDWDKLSSNDHIGDASFNVNELIKDAPQPDHVTGLYDKKEKGEHDLTEMKLSLMSGNGSAWDSKFSPVIKIRAKYQPYDALRQTFWRTYLKQYDTDDTDTISHLELTSMLDSLNSTLTRSTIHSFFTRNNKDPHKDELTFDEVIQCLETELRRPDSEKRKIEDANEGGGDGLDTSVSPTPFKDNIGRLDLDKLDFSGPPHVGMSHDDKKPFISGPYQTEPSELPLQDVGQAVEHTGQRQASFNSTSSSSEDTSEDSSSSGIPSSPSIGEAAGQVGDASAPTPKAKKTRLRRRKKTLVAKEASSGSASSIEDPFERVINVKNCPLCHRPRLSSKAERDIVTHLAVCASQDWGKVDSIMVGNFVTASQAQRKWYTKIISKVSSGDYKLGANSANIIVQNRITGQLEEEKMQVYVRLGIRLLYKGASSRMEGVRARKLLKSLSIKQGIKYDSPESARDIPAFIEFHGLNVDEILGPLDSFRTFNEFFYRKLKPTARPIEEPDDPYRLVSAADCRMMTFPSVDEATRLWIKGRDFTVRKLLGEAYANQVDRYVGGALAIFRLAPQDYHRFHSPVEGTIGKMTYIAGEYYTVNPQAIRTALDVYGENARKIVPIDSPQFGRVMAVCVGAMMVGSIKTTVKEGDFVHRGQEFGYFAFGGSTIVVLFEKGAVEWDEDLVINGKASLETLVRVGMGIGYGRRQQDTD